MNRKYLLILCVCLLALFLIPDIWTLDGWEIWNISYHENKRFDDEWICFDALPVPKHSYTYRSLFLDISLSLDFCDDYKFWRDWDFTIFLGVEKWVGSDFYLPMFWFSLSDKGISTSTLGDGNIKIGDNWIELWEIEDD